jgi:hypothetical protein
VATVWLRSRKAAIPYIPAPVHSDDEVHEFLATVVLPGREQLDVPGSRAVLRQVTTGAHVDVAIAPPVQHQTRDAKVSARGGAGGCRYMPF